MSDQIQTKTKPHGFGLWLGRIIAVVCLLLAVLVILVATNKPSHRTAISTPDRPDLSNFKLR